MYLLTLFIFVRRLLDRRDGRTLVLVVAAAFLAASTEFADLAAPALDETCVDQASLDFGAATLALAASSAGREWLRRATARDINGCGASAATPSATPPSPSTTHATSRDHRERKGRWRQLDAAWPRAEALRMMCDRKSAAMGGSSLALGHSTYQCEWTGKPFTRSTVTMSVESDLSNA